MTDILFTLDIVAPVFVTILLGYFLRRFGMIDDTFVRKSSTLVFYVALPSMLVAELARADLGKAIDPAAVIALTSTTIVLASMAWGVARRFTSDGRSQGAFIQGTFRGNVAIIALPLVSLTLGPDSLAMSVLLLAIIMPLYNVLAVLALTLPVAGSGQVRWARIGTEIATNPLIIAIAVGILLSLLPFSLPSFALRTIKYLGELTFPLGLLGIGAGITVATVRATMKLTLVASITKTALLPVACCAVAWALGADNRTIGALFLVAGAPTAISSFIMAKAMDGDADLAGSIVGVSTAISAVTLSGTVLGMRLLGIV